MLITTKLFGVRVAERYGTCGTLSRQFNCQE